ncbi:MAG: hypothetical protein P4L51_13595 [Puia sp.]|nr:hypothetical protein [Puia sp.]
MIHKNEIGEVSSRASLKKEVYLFVFFLIAFLFFAYYNDWEYDESTSYNGVLTSGLWELLTYNKFKTANNHLLNSLYFKLLQNWHITNVVYYRLLSVSGFVLFFIANSKLLKLLRINYAYIIILTVTPFFFYFTLGRGYALAIGCFAMSFFYLMKYVHKQEVRYEYLVVIFGAISSLAIFSFLYGFLSLFIVLCFFKRRHLMDVHTLLLSTIVLALLIYIYILGKIINYSDPSIIGVKNFNLFSYGTVSSILSDFSYRDQLIHLFFDESKFVLFVKYFKIVITLCIIIPMVYGSKIRSGKIDMSNSKTILVVLISLPFLIMISANIFTHALYPLKRAVFYLHYLVLLLILISTVTFSKKPVFYIPVIVIFLTSFFYSAYIYYDLSRPTIKEILAKTDKYPLYVLLKNNPNITLINNLYGIDKKDIIQDSVLNEVVPKIQSDTSKIRYLLSWPEYKDSTLNVFRNNKVYNCRGGNVLIEIFR